MEYKTAKQPLSVFEFEILKEVKTLNKNLEVMNENLRRIEK